MCEVMRLRLWPCVREHAQ